MCFSRVGVLFEGGNRNREIEKEITKKRTREN